MLQAFEEAKLLPDFKQNDGISKALPTVSVKSWKPTKQMKTNCLTTQGRCCWFAESPRFETMIKRRAEIFLLFIAEKYYVFAVDFVYCFFVYCLVMYLLITINIIIVIIYA